MRIFSIIEWHQFAWLIISLALLGFAASGTILSIFRTQLLERATALVVTLPAITSLALAGSLSIATRIDWRSLELLWNPTQSLNLLTIYLVLAIPFCCTGMFIGLSFMRWPTAISNLYGADLSGAAVGALLAIALLQTVEPSSAWFVLAGVNLSVSLLMAIAARHRLIPIPLATSLLVIAIALGFPPAIESGEYKSITQTLRIPGSKIIDETSSPLGYLELVENERVPLRLAPGLSLNYFDELPLQRGVFVDGEGPIILNATAGPLEHVDHTTFGIVESLAGTPENAFVSGLQGMPQIARLRQLGSARIIVSESDEEIVDLIDAQPGWGGNVLGSSAVTIFKGDPRTILARVDGLLDLIYLPFSPGGSSLTPVSTVTVEAFVQMINRLDESGLIAVTTPLESPPRATPRLLIGLSLALEKAGLDPDRHVAAIRAWDVATIAASRSPLDDGQIHAVRELAQQRSFDLIWLPGMREDEANQFNVLDQPWHHDAAREILSGPVARDQFIERYKFDLTPPTDDRPWFGSAMKWSTLIELLRLRSEGGTALIRNGYPVLLIAAVQSLGSGIILILLPLLLVRRKTEATEDPGPWRVLLTFGSLGLAFLFVEIAYIHRLGVILGRPLEATTIVLGSFLLFSGIGSVLSRRLDRAAGLGRTRFLLLSSLATAALIVIEIPLLLTASNWILHLPHLVRVGLSVTLIAPLAFSMGLPFPTALDLVRTRGNEWWIAWAWAINGCASVVSAIGAVILSIHFGLSAVSALAAALYGVAGLSLGTLTIKAS